MSLRENNQNKQNQEINNSKNKTEDVIIKKNFYKNQSRNIKNGNISKENNSQKSTKEISPRNNSLTVDEENVIIKIIENKQNNSSISKICEFFNQSNLSFSKIHNKILYNEDQDNFIFNNIIKNNKMRINNISKKLNSMKNPDDISTKESFLSGYINSKNNKSRNIQKNNLNDEVKLSCCFFKGN